MTKLGKEKQSLPLKKTGDKSQVPKNLSKLSGVVDVGDCIMVGKDEAISMLATALQRKKSK